MLDLFWNWLKETILMLALSLRDNSNVSPQHSYTWEKKKKILMNILLVCSPELVCCHIWENWSRRVVLFENISRPFDQIDAIFIDWIVLLCSFFNEHSSRYCAIMKPKSINIFLFSPWKCTQSAFYVNLYRPSSARQGSWRADDGPM